MRDVHKKIVSVLEVYQKYIRGLKQVRIQELHKVHNANNQLIS